MSPERMLSHICEAGVLLSVGCLHLEGWGRALFEFVSRHCKICVDLHRQLYFLLFNGVTMLDSCNLSLWCLKEEKIHPSGYSPSKQEIVFHKP